jgi:ribonuclease HIII
MGVLLSLMDGVEAITVPAAKYSLKQTQEKARFKESLKALPATDWTEKSEQYCDYRLDGKTSVGWLRAKQFTNGTLYLEASTDQLLERMTALLSASQAAVPKPAAQQPLFKPSPNGSQAKTEKPSGLLAIEGAYIGTDESGKGDYFGPLVIAGVFVTEQTAAVLRELGVMDSKKLTDVRIEAIYRQILDTVGEKAVAVVEIGPAKYNELYDRLKTGGKNLNHLLAWGHATAIENLLVRFPDCSQAIADQFGNERYILSQLKEKGKGITLHQTHRAEANIGVAAASIVARYRFTKKLKQLSAQYGVLLPLGASPHVKTVARQLVAAQGQAVLANVAKLHFKTTQEL